jgi:hypothetical protein
MRFHQPTIDYVTRRSAEGRTKREITRCLKRFLAREIYNRAKVPGLTPSGRSSLGEFSVLPSALALDDVVDLADLWAAGVFKRNIGEERHHMLPEGLELLLRIPDLIEEQLPVGVERDVGVKSVGREYPRLAETPNDLVVLLRGRRRHRCVADKDAHDRSSVSVAGVQDAGSNTFPACRLRFS